MVMIGKEINLLILETSNCYKAIHHTKSLNTMFLVCSTHLHYNTSPFTQDTFFAFKFLLFAAIINLTLSTGVISFLLFGFGAIFCSDLDLGDLGLIVLLRPSAMYFFTGDSTKLSSDIDDTEETTDLGVGDGVSSHFITRYSRCLSEQCLRKNHCLLNNT
jgi:hypothetical protein